MSWRKIFCGSFPAIFAPGDEMKSSKLKAHRYSGGSNDVIDSTSCQEGSASIRKPAALLTVGKLPL
eukprot:scaffold390_cov149-Skeletonema_menzelii.AAC.18